MGMNRLKDAMYEFWKEGMLTDSIARSLASEFSQFTVKEVLDLRNPVIENHFLRASLTSYESHRAMQVVARARKLRYTWAGKRIEDKSNLTPKQRHDEPSRPPPPSTPPPPPLTYTKHLYDILHLKQKSDIFDKSIVEEIEERYFTLTGAMYPYATRNMKVHTAARILHWRNSRMLYNVRGDSVMEWMLLRIPIVISFVSRPRLSGYDKKYVTDQDIQDQADANNWSGRGF